MGAAVMATVAAVTAAPSAGAVAPIPDPGFGAGGAVVDVQREGFGDVLAMSDGGVVAVSGAAAGPTEGPGVLARYDATGALVTGFGSGGVVTVGLPGYRITLTHVQRGAAGTLVAFGSYQRSGIGCGVVVVRVAESTGARDTTFGSDGVALVGRGGHLRCSPQGSGGGTVLPGGRIVVASTYFPQSTAGEPRGWPPRLFVAELTRDGRADPLVGTGGWTLPAVPSVSAWGDPVVSSDGSIAVPVATSTAIGTVRLRPNGVPDTRFSGDGLALRRPFGVSLGEGAVAVVPQPLGRLVVAGAFDTRGYTDERWNDVALVRMNGAGVADAAFARGAGLARLPHTDVGRVRRLPDGAFVVAGTDVDGSYFIDVPNLVGRVARVGADGAVDRSWGTSGVMSVGAAGRAQTGLSAVALGPAGTMTLAGSSSSQYSPPDGSSVTWSATLVRLAAAPSVRVRGWLESRLSGAYGGWRSCGTTLATPCALGSTWYLTGGGWPFEARADARVVVQVQRRGADGVWRSYRIPTSWVTDDGAFRGAGKLVSVGLYRFRAAVPTSQTTLLTYSAWTYGKR